MQATIAQRIKQNRDVVVAAAIIGIVLMIIIPVPPFLLDILLTISLLLGMMVPLITMFTTGPLDFSTFPTLLLVATLYRLALNISSTRLILSQAYAGHVIDAFGHFVVGGSYVIGMVVFIIITVIQFVVITNGAGRVAEVAARFTLDAMPGKQMAIDADLNAGLITEQDAKDRRRKLQRESDFFGAMDGASKFVRGDAIAGVVIILVNIIGGLIIGMVNMHLALLQSVQTYTVLTIGDGLVTQVPALLISTATGIMVTRATAEASLGHELTRQFTSYPKVLYISGGILFILGLAPGMPHVLFMLMAVAAGGAAWFMTQENETRGRKERETSARQAIVKKREPENVFSYFQVDPLEIEIGYNLIPLTDENQGGDMLPRLAAVRRQLAAEMGIFVRPVRIRDNLQLKPGAYLFKIRGVEMAHGELIPGQYLAMDPLHQEITVPGIKTKEPTFGLEAWWVREADREGAELAGLTVVDASTVLVTHLTEFIKRHAAELLGRQEIKELLDVVKEKNPATVDELVPDLLSLGEVQKVLANLLSERVSIRDLVSILEALADGARQSKDTDFLTERARQALARAITRQFAGRDDKLTVITLHPRLEQVLADSVQETQLGAYPVLPPDQARDMIDRMKHLVESLTAKGTPPVLLTSSRVRLPLRRLIGRFLPNLAILSLNEILPGVEVEAVGTVTPSGS
ncbi:MAG TPA: flagellar biosynthesis protein FlhA [Spirochaetia bacterium]|nr:flagellar biosynthesis protein FlhA [Spirochaetia bacterium]